MSPRALRFVLPILFVALGSAQEASAQGRPRYISRVLAQPYVPLSGATPVLVSPTYDGAKTIPIGFEFEFYGERFEAIEVAENGLITFQRSCTSGCDFGETCNDANLCERGWISSESSGAIPSPNTPNRMVAAFWDDLTLVGNTPPQPTDSVVATRLVGAAPHRERVIEWKNVRHYTNFAPTRSATSFQIRLQEGSHTIRIHYGPTQAATHDTAGWSGIIGMEDELGEAAVLPLPCSSSNARCSWANLGALTHRVIEIGVPNAPELIGSLEPVLGAAAGARMDVRVHARNVGLQPTDVPFDVGVYVSSDATISPASDILVGRARVDALAPNAETTVTIPARIPRDLEPGYYVLGAVLDPERSVRELNRENNVLISSEPFLVGTDLSVSFDTDLQPLPTSGPGEIVYRVLNRGSALRRVGYRLLLSVDSEPDASDIVLAQGTRDLDASANVLVRETVEVPAGTTAGYYTVIAVLDPDDRVQEADESNNSTFIFSVVGSDLFVNGMEAPAESGRGAELSVTMRVLNTGAQVDGVPYALYLSTDSTLDAMDPLALHGTFTAAQGVETEVVASGRVPESVAGGTYTLIAVIDEAGLVPELDELNNVFVSPSTIRLVGPDLVAQSLAGAPLAFRGQPYTYTAVVRNGGGEPVRGFFVSIHFSENQLITTTDPLLEAVGPLDLEPGESLVLERTVTVPADATPGPTWLGLIVDWTSLIVEDLEQNNLKRSSSLVQVRDVAPDYSASGVRVPQLAGVGESFVVERTLENRGNLAGTLAYDIYLVGTSTSMRFGHLGSGERTLDARASEVGIDRVKIPGDVPPGLYRIEYVLDPTGGVEEIVEDNNKAYSRDAVEVDLGDLAIETAELPVATVGLEYRFELEARGGSGPLTWSIQSGALPTGLELAGDTGVIQGTPTTEGTAMFSIRVTDGTLTETRPFELRATTPSGVLDVGTRWVPPAWAGQRFEFPMTALGGTPPYRWRVTPELPVGFVLTSSGTIAGRSEVTVPSGVYTFTVSDATGAEAETLAAFRVLDRQNALSFAPKALADGLVDLVYREALSAERGVPPYTFALVEGTLPPGLALTGEASSGFAISGTPERAGVFTFRLEVTDAAGDADQNHFVVTIEPGASVTFVTQAIPSARVGVPYQAADGRPVALKAVLFEEGSMVTYSISNGALPAGLELTEAGILAGTPTEAGVFSFIARAHDVAGNTEDLRAFGLLVEGEATPPEVEEGCSCTTSSRTARPSRDGGLALFGAALVALGLARLRVRRSLLGLLLAATASLPGTARAQADAGAPTSASDGGVADAASSGQVPYFFSEFSEPYVARTGGTPVTFLSNDDDEVEYTLPFPFRFFDQENERLYIGTNGTVGFRPGVDGPSNPRLADTFEPNGFIAVFWDDLIAGPVTVHVEGDAPNRVAIIQWADMSHYPSGGAERFQLQLWLYEGPSARFELRYGAFTNLTAARVFDGTIGFEDFAGNFGHDFATCSPQCDATALAGLEGRVFRAMQDAGEDVYALGVAVTTQEEPARVYQNIPFEVTTKLASYHAAPIGPFRYSLQLVGPDDAPDRLPVFTSGPVTLDEYETRVLVDAVTIPLATAPGQYRLELVADPANALEEPNEDNNRVLGTQRIVLGERAADLRVADVSAAVAVARPGDALDVTLSIENAGNLDASTDWRLVLSQNRAPSLEDVVLAEASEPVPLALGARSDVRVRVVIPEGLAAGRYSLGALVDTGNGVRELSEVNNAGLGATTIRVGLPTVSVTTSALPVGFVGFGYEARLTASGGDDSFTWALDGGALPAGLVFDPATGALSGTPSEATQVSLTFTATSLGASASRTFELEIRPVGGPLTIVTRQLPTGFVGAAYPAPGSSVGALGERNRIQVVGGVGPATFALVGGAPRGLTLSSDGQLSGVLEQHGLFEVVVSATDGQTSTTRVLSLQVVEPGRLTLVVGAMPTARAGEPYAYDLLVVGHDPNTAIEFRVIDGELPRGMDLSPNGLIAGTPDAPGTFTFGVEVAEKNASGARDSANVVLVVKAPEDLTIIPATLPDAVIGQAFSAVFEARQGEGPFVWGYDLPTELPRGLAFETVDVQGEKKLRLFGVPEALPDPDVLGVETGGLFTFRVRLDDARGRHAERSVSLRLVAAASKAAAMETDEGCGCSTSGRRGKDAWGAVALLAIALGLRRRRR